MNNRKYYAHSREGEPPDNWQPLEQHLTNVATLSAKFAKSFGGEEWARLAGLWHDLGKYSNAFQKKLYDANGIESHLETKPGKVIHSHAGGHLAQQVMRGGMERIFCWLIMGHHAGLADYPSDRTGARSLESKMKKPEESNSLLENVPEKIKSQDIPDFPAMLCPGDRQADFSFFIRMLFSCVVDADFLDTEAFVDEKRRDLRREKYPSMSTLHSCFDNFMDEKCREAKPTKVNQIRAEGLEQCRNAAEKEGVFSLTIPTGGGKTLSSMAFALRHAELYDKKRIIYVIPYTSIIEQTAKVFRKIPGFELAVLEHHSNVSGEDEKKESSRSRLAAENWDAPIVVTTSVQFFESIYGYKTSRCRKLHNIADSVVIFDEAQCLPPSYLRPVVFAIRELHRHYGVTPVFCTATQPVLTKTESFDFNFKEGFEFVTEIIDTPDTLSQNLKRVELGLCSGLAPMSYELLAKSILSEKQSTLCIVNKKADARVLARLLPEKQTIHLSTNMCAAHRSRILDQVRKCLEEESQRMFVISTSLVEAGVDIDFPVVYRALAGLDSIAQAAGRCNREGKLTGYGKTLVFVPEDQPDYVKSPASLALGYLSEDELAEVFLPETFSRYFRERFFQVGENALDEKNIRGLLPQNLDNIYFQTAAEKFQLIEDDWQTPLIVPYEKSPELIARLLDYGARSLFRKLQRYTINVSGQVIKQLLNEAHVCELIAFPGAFYLQDTGLYTERFGFVPPDEFNGYSPESMIV